MMTDALARKPASEKRQGTKSRWVMLRRCRGRYGDLTAGSRLRRLDRSDFRDRFAAIAIEHGGENDRTAQFAGKLAVIPGLGAFAGRNITPDKETGIGTWTSQQIVTAFNNGKTARRPRISIDHALA